MQHSTINNLGFGRSVDETLRVLQAIQYVQSHPDEVCPAGWQPGQKVSTVHIVIYNCCEQGACACEMLCVWHTCAT